MTNSGFRSRPNRFDTGIPQIELAWRSCRDRRTPRPGCAYPATQDVGQVAALPAPMIAILDSGEIVQATRSFDAALGRESGYSTGRFIQSLLAEHTAELSAVCSAVEYLHRSYGHVIGFRHRDSSVVHAIIGLSVQLRPLIIVAFHDVTEQLLVAHRCVATTLGSLTVGDAVRIPVAPSGTGINRTVTRPPRARESVPALCIRRLDCTRVRRAAWGNGAMTTFGTAPQADSTTPEASNTNCAYPLQIAQTERRATVADARSPGVHA